MWHARVCARAPRTTHHPLNAHTHTHTTDRERARLSFGSSLQVVVNFFDEGAVKAPQLIARLVNDAQRIEGTWLPGMKTLFWKRHLTPKRTRGLRFVWLFDSDSACSARRQSHALCTHVGLTHHPRLTESAPLLPSPPL